MASKFVKVYDIVFFEIRFFSYKQFRKVNLTKIIKFIKYIFIFIFIILKEKPRYVLYPISFDKKPFLKDIIFVFIGKMLGCSIIQFDFGRYLIDLYNSSGNLTKKLLIRLLKSIDAFIVMGENTKKFYSGFFPQKRIFVVPGSVQDTAGYLDNITKNSNETINVLYFSLLSELKGLWTALNSIPIVIEHYTKINYIFVGPADSQKTLENFHKFIKENKLENFVIHSDYVENEAKRIEYFRKSDIFIFPTQRDVFGLVLLHAMAESLPIISTMEGNIPEIIEDGENGYLITKGDSGQLAEKILRIANDVDLRKKMGKAGRAKYLSKYTTSNYEKNMIDTFEAIKNLDINKC
jgi:glycosyltransferase involved in cell wall biosynthesis